MLIEYEDADLRRRRSRGSGASRIAFDRGRRMRAVAAIADEDTERANAEKTLRGPFPALELTRDMAAAMKCGAGLPSASIILTIR
jgi:hypothetical protein